MSARRSRPPSGLGNLVPAFALVAVVVIVLWLCTWAVGK